MLKNDVCTIISKTLNTSSFTLLSPMKKGFGDFAIHLRSIDKAELNMTPEKVTSLLATIPDFARVEKKGDFINIFLRPTILLKEARNIALKAANRTLFKTRSGQRINLEFGQPNTHKLPHIGHLFSYCYGGSMARILESVGHTVFRCNYQGDIGPHVAKCLWSVQSKGSSIDDLKTLDEKVALLQQCYQDGSQAYEVNADAKMQINTLNAEIYHKAESVLDLWKKTRSWSLDYYKRFEEQLGISFDTYYFESDVFTRGLEIVKKNIGNIFTESEGAIIFEGEPYGLHTRVFVNNFGNPTYEAKDVGLVQQKYADWKFDKAIITTASEQNEYWKVVKCAIELCFPHFKDKIEHRGFGMVQLKGGKISSRAGTIVGAVELVETVKTKVATLVATSSRSHTSQEKDRIINVVALGAIKYGLLKSEAHKNIVFDIDESVATEGNSGPYLQYTYARARTVLMKASYSPSAALSALPNNTTQEELALMLHLTRFSETVEAAAERYAPHLLCTYLYTLGQHFNLFYEKCPILNADEETRTFRIELTDSVARVLQEGLHMLGIDVLDSI